MKEVLETVKGKITEYNPETGDMVIRASYPDWFTASKREYRDVRIELIDSRRISNRQRNACYAMIKEISNFTGMSAAGEKDHLKIKFLVDDLGKTADGIFSLSDCSVSLACAFQKFLVRFILENDIPCSRRLLEFVDDTGDYLYACLRFKKCCICGMPADLHHVDRVGMGHNRQEIVHEGMRVLSLCREHHSEAHTMGHKEFAEKYHLGDGWVVLDKELCKVYGLKRGKDRGA